MSDGYYPPLASGFPDTSQYPAAVNAAIPILNADYGWDCSYTAFDWAPEYHIPTTVTLHHTAGRLDDVLQYVEVVYNFHAMGPSHCWGDIGYQRLVGRDADDGEIHHVEGRFSGDSSPNHDEWGSMSVVGAHAGGHNTDNAGLAAIGDYSSVPPDAATLRAIKAHLARMFFELDLDDSNALVGHRDLGSTECPGDELYALLPEIREHLDWCQSCGY